MNGLIEAMRRCCSKWKWVRCVCESGGGALVETALAMPLLSLLLLGASEFGLVDYEAIEVTNAARAGVQYGAQGSTYAADLTGIRNAAKLDAPNITLGTTTTAMSYICSDGTAPTGTPLACLGGVAIETILTVRTQATFDPVIHIPFVTPTFTLYGQATQKVLQ